MISLKAKARELSAHFHAIRERLHGLDKCNPETSEFLNVQEAHVLMSIGTGGAMTMSAIARALQLTLSSVTSVVDKLEKKDFVQRGRTATDRRVVRVELTKHGRKFYDLVEEAHLRLTGSILKMLDRDEQETLLRLFRKITDKLRQQR